MRLLKEIVVTMTSTIMFILCFHGLYDVDSILPSLVILILVILYRVMKYKDEDFLIQYRKKFWIGFLILLSIALVNVNDTSEGESKVPEQSSNYDIKELKSLKKDKFWSDEIKKISSLNVTKEKKYAFVMTLSKGYEIKGRDTKYYVDYINNEQTSDKYMSKLNKDEYALKMVLISYLLSESSIEKLPLEVKAFAFNLYQNSKYIYRGVDKPGSEDVLETTRKLNKNKAFVQEYLQK